MAVARMVCSDCGADVSAGDLHCGKCGSLLERAGESSPASSPAPAEVSRRCDVCGNENKNAGSYCESCGSRLSGSLATSPTPRRAQKKNRQPSLKAKKVASVGRLEPWQIVAGIVIVALIAFFVYSELIRDVPKGEAHVHDNVPPPAVSMQEIDRLQAIVDANASDAPSLLRLANVLHDNAIQDSRFLLRAIETYKKYLALQPANPDARVDLGICYFEMGRVDSANSAKLFATAIQEMESALRFSPTHQPAAYNLGIVNLNAGNLEQSNKWMKKAMELNPQSELGQRAQRILEQHSFQ